VLHVKDLVVAHFPQRRQAAGQTARLTGKPATYTGLGGEQIDSTKTPPAPYPDQNVLIARFALDRIQKNLPQSPPERDIEWQQIGWRNSFLTHLVDRFGDDLKPAILAEIDARGLGETFKKLRLVEGWRKRPD
jgi:hypothetical protein